MRLGFDIPFGGAKSEKSIKEKIKDKKTICKAIITFFGKFAIRKQNKA